MFLFYSGKRDFYCSLCKYIVLYILDNGYWAIGADFTYDSGFISSNDRGLLFLPTYGWKYNDGRNWVDDETLTLTSKH